MYGTHSTYYPKLKNSKCNWKPEFTKKKIISGFPDTLEKAFGTSGDLGFCRDSWRKGILGRSTGNPTWGLYGRL